MLNDHLGDAYWRVVRERGGFQWTAPEFQARSIRSGIIQKKIEDGSAPTSPRRPSRTASSLSSVTACAKIGPLSPMLPASGRRLISSPLIHQGLCRNRRCDRRAVAADTLSLRVAGPFGTGPAMDRQRALRAAEGLRGLLRRESGAAIHLYVKNSPIASGIGGGSADAAATLRALIALWR